MFVAIEGIDTCGKSTQAKALKSKFKDAIFTKEPGGTALGAKLRELILFGESRSKMAEFFLFLADRAEHVNKVILPNIERLIISDRSVISGVAYALDSINLAHEKIAELNAIASGNLLPDLVVILKLDSATLQERLSKKTHDKIESRGINYLLNIQQNLFKACELLEKISGKKIEILSLDSALSVESITKKISDKINNEMSNVRKI